VRYFAYRYVGHLSTMDDFRFSNALPASEVRPPRVPELGDWIVLFHVKSRTIFGHGRLDGLRETKSEAGSVVELSVSDVSVCETNRGT
jgi:hypothetical protein